MQDTVYRCYRYVTGLKNRFRRLQAGLPTLFMDLTEGLKNRRLHTISMVTPSWQRITWVTFPYLSFRNPQSSINTTFNGYQKIGNGASVQSKLTWFWSLWLLSTKLWYRRHRRRSTRRVPRPRGPPSYFWLDRIALVSIEPIFSIKLPLTTRISVNSISSKPNKNSIRSEAESRSFGTAEWLKCTWLANIPDDKYSLTPSYLISPVEESYMTKVSRMIRVP